MNMHELAGLLGLSVYDPVFWMPLLCLGVFLLMVLLGTVFDGFDLGVALLLPFAGEHKDRLVNLLGPWRNINEFWLLFGMVFFLAAFPKAWGFVFSMMYWPLVCIGIGALLRNVSFEFRLRSADSLRRFWMLLFFAGSVMNAFGQGWLLGKLVVGFQAEEGYGLFALLVAFGMLALYMLLGAAWLIMRVDGVLQQEAIGWAKRTVRVAAGGLIAIMTGMGLSNMGIFYKWALIDTFSVVFPAWIVILSAFALIEILLKQAHKSEWLSRLPFLLLILLACISLGGVAYSYFPFLVYDELSLWDSIDSIVTLRYVVWGMVMVLPVLLVYIAWSYGDVFDKLRS